MPYISTRGMAPPLDFPGVLLAGLADDGGLYMPQAWPHLGRETLREWQGLPYPALAARILSLFAEPLDPDLIAELCARAYAGFTHPATVPLIQLDSRLFVAELFHGPTLAFKDLALQIVGLLFEHVLASGGRRVTLLGATSGDTGSAAIEACRGRAHLRVAILHPKGRTSEVQRRQMTTVHDENVLNLAVEGDFDQCQALVKAAFADLAFREKHHLSAVNSINWARIAAQIPYYIATALALGAPDREVAFAVPSGNFGNVFAAWAASRMGLPVARFIVGSNRNDILTRFIDANDMSLRPVEPSLSPSMDIQVSSNVERLLFELLERDGGRTAGLLASFGHSGRLSLPEPAWQAARAHFAACRLSDEATLAAMARLRRETGYVADPHSAIGIEAARALAPPGVPVIAMATAHPAKFPDAVARALGAPPPVPAPIAHLYERQEKFTVVPPELGAIQSAIAAWH